MLSPVALTESRKKIVQIPELNPVMMEAIQRATTQNVSKTVIKVNNFRPKANTARFAGGIAELPSPYMNHKKEVIERKVIVKTKSTKTLNHQDVVYNGKEYTVCYTKKKDIPVLFVIDTEDKEKIIYRHCHIFNGYPACTRENEAPISVHIIVMNDEDKSVSEDSIGKSVDHINRVRRDARKENLAFKTHSEQVQNQFIRDRTVELPDDCGIEHDDIPKHVFYRNEEGRGERFSVEIKAFEHIPKNIRYKKTTGRKGVPLRIKLQQAIYYLKWLSETYPELRSVIRIDTSVEEQRKRLTQEYNDIIQLTSYPQEVINANLVDFIYDKKKDYSMEDFDDVEKVNEHQDAGKKSSTDLPVGCGVKKTDIPKYCYYKPASEIRGDKFIIDGHPKLVQRGKRQLGTPESKLMSTKEKFDILMMYLNCLENDLEIPTIERKKAIRNTFTPLVKDIGEEITTSKPEQSGGATMLPATRYRKVHDDSEIDFKRLPRYMHYKSATKDRAEYFEIRNHPNLTTSSKTTRTSAAVSRVDKYNECISYLTSLDENKPFEVFEIVRAGKFNVNPEMKEKERNYVHKVNNLPDGSDIKPDEIPKYVYYKGQSDSHGSCFVIIGHPKFDGKKLSRSSTELSDREKLDEILDHLSAIEEGREFTKYKLVRVKKTIVEPEPKEIAPKPIHKVTNLPEGSDINPDDIPEYVYYKGENGETGSYFFIRNHPKFEGKKNSRTSKSLTDREKLDEILDHLRAIEEGHEFTKYKMVCVKKVKEV